MMEQPASSKPGSNHWNSRVRLSHAGLGSVNLASNTEFDCERVLAPSGWFGSTDHVNYTVGDLAKNGKAIYPGDLQGVPWPVPPWRWPGGANPPCTSGSCRAGRCCFAQVVGEFVL